ncbi:MAG TPA: hypothetical protein VGO75_06645 [Gemmatimonadaceae bacterium]|jgi:hypothetical protein|nr:hypothetical protein [Gemmatimonadaceae bacterium]
MATKKKTDLSAALTGLVLGAVTIFLLLSSIVLITNAHYRDLAKSEGGASEAPTSQTPTTPAAHP